MKNPKSAASIWNNAKPATPDNPYCQSKGIKPHGAETEAGIKKRLTLPLYNARGELSSLQFIDAAGKKTYLAGHTKQNCFFVIGAINKSTNKLLICEGFATGDTLFEATKIPTVVSFDCGNLIGVAQIFRGRYPTAEIVLAADDDWQTDGNPGITHATAAAAAIGGKIAVPNFSGVEDREKKDTDFNDLKRLCGPSTVKKCLAAASSPPLIVAPPTDPMPNARAFVLSKYTSNQHDNLIFNGADFHTWAGSHWPEFKPAELRAALYSFFADAQYKDANKLKTFAPNKNRIDNLIDALKAISFKRMDAVPCWLDKRETPDATDLIPMKNGLFDIKTRKLIPHSPGFFNTFSLPFDYLPKAKAPKKYLKFMNELFGNDAESQRCLQEIFGYFLTADTTLQKIFLIVGPKRSGKGTLARVLTAMIGGENTAGPTLTSLSNNFGLQPLIGKSVAVISDAKLHVANSSVIVERLLSISGEDSLTIDRKFREPWNGKLSARFLILTNELPRLADTSGALASRFIIINLRHSFYGKENPNLTNELVEELLGIFLWALEGLKRLRKRGYFVQPKASADAVEQLEDLASPISAFIKEHCTLDKDARILCSDLYYIWCKWCVRNGKRETSLPVFGRDLRAVCTDIRVMRHRQRGEAEKHYHGIGLKNGRFLGVGTHPKSGKHHK
jgi:putative DNA primase/helicase